MTDYVKEIDKYQRRKRRLKNSLELLFEKVYSCGLLEGMASMGELVQKKTEVTKDNGEEKE
ncbi:hypothetical protein ACFLS9_07805 [Bacteroidota bacterium]